MDIGPQATNKLNAAFTSKPLRSRDTRVIYAFEFVTGLLFFLPVLVLFLIERGLTFYQIMVLQSAFSAALIILEIPSGYITDIIGRKNSLILACISFFFAAAGYSMGTDFIHFLAAEMAYAVFFAFVSGTVSALCYDNLLSNGEKAYFKPVWSRAISHNLMGLALACLIGGAAATVDLSLPIHLMVFVALFALGLAFLMREKAYMRPKKRTPLSHALHFSRNNPQMRHTISYSAFSEGIMHSGIWVIQPYLTLEGLSTAQIGVFFAMIYLVSSFGCRFCAMIKKEHVDQALLALPLICAISYLGLWIAPTLWMSFAFFLIFFSRGASKVLLEQLANEPTPSGMRATVLSYKGMGERLVYSAVILSLGGIWDTFGMRAAMAFLFSISAIFAVINAFFHLRR